MKKEKWLLNEIDRWKQEGLIGDEAAEALSLRYVPKKNANVLIIFFSVIGAALIGTGVILIGARNWYELPLFLRVSISFLPLILAQAAAVYTLKYRPQSLPWRESAALLVMAGIFTVIAMVGQIFHFPSDMGAYLLTCALLSLPMMLLLNAASPLAVYYWAVLYWATEASSSGGWGALALPALFAAGAALLWINRRQNTARLSYLLWITLLAGFAGVLIMGGLLDGSLLLGALCYFILLVSVRLSADNLRLPFQVVGILGALVTLAVLTYRGMWDYSPVAVEPGFWVMAGVMLLGAAALSVGLFRRDKLKFAFVLSLAAVCAARVVWMIWELDEAPYDLLFMLFSNLVLFGAGIGFVAHGARTVSLAGANTGMAALCTLIIMRFFDSDMDILWRGVVFLVLGIGFLLVNLGILRAKKKRAGEVRI